MHWEQNELNGKKFTKRQYKDGALVLMDFGSILYIHYKDENSVFVEIEDAANAKFWGGSFSLFNYMKELKKVVTEHGYTITETHEDYNHFGISYQVVIHSHFFDVIFEESKKIFKNMFQKTELRLFSSITADSIGHVPFSLCKSKNSQYKVLKISYDCMNRKFWHGDVNLEDFLEAQYLHVTKHIPKSSILDFEVEHPEGMSLVYEIEMPITTTRSEASSWIHDHIKIPVVEILKKTP